MTRVYVRGHFRTCNEDEECEEEEKPKKRKSKKRKCKKKKTDTGDEWLKNHCSV